MDAGHVGNPRASADVDEDPRRGQLLLADADRVRPLEPGMALDDRAAVHACAASFRRPSRALAETVSARAFTLGMSIRDVAVEHDAVVGGPAREMCGIGAGHQRFGRHAAGVDAGAAEQLAFDERDCHSGASQAAGERGAGLAGPDDDGVEAGPSMRTLSAPLTVRHWESARPTMSRLQNSGQSKHPPGGQRRPGKTEPRMRSPRRAGQGRAWFDRPLPPGPERPLYAAKATIAIARPAPAG